MKSIQILQVCPEQFLEAISNGLKKQLEILKKDFQPKQPDELMSPQEVAEYFKVNETTIWRWEKQGELKKYGIGNKAYYKRSEIESSIIPLSEDNNPSKAC